MNVKPTQTRTACGTAQGQEEWDLIERGSFKGEIQMECSFMV